MVFVKRWIGLGAELLRVVGQIESVWVQNVFGFRFADWRGKRILPV